MHATLIQVRKIIDSLPQRKFMKDEDIERWIESVWENEPDRIIWHANRLNGFGGSEIGVLVADMRTKEGDEFSPTYHTFKTAKEVIQEKLCITTPTRDEDENENDLRRGTIGEEWLIDRLVDQLKSQYGTENVKVDKDTMAAMGGVDTNPMHEWLVGNIDLALIINEQRILVDIKWPRASKAAYMAKMTPFTYDCQLKHYELRAEQFRVPIHFDKTVLACFDSDQFTFHLGVVEGEPNLKDDILRAGEHYFNDFLLKGRIPDLPQSKKPTATTDILSGQVNAKLKQLHALKVLIKEASEQQDAMEREISGELSKLKLPPNPKLDFIGGLGSIKGKSSCNYNDDLLAQYAPKYGIKYKEMTDKVRTDIHTALMADPDITNNEIMEMIKPEYSFTFPLTRARKGAVYEKVKELKALSSKLVGENLSALDNRLLSAEEMTKIDEQHKQTASYKPTKLERQGDELTTSPKNSKKPKKQAKTTIYSSSETPKKTPQKTAVTEEKQVKPIIISSENFDEEEDDSLYFKI